MTVEIWDGVWQAVPSPARKLFDFVVAECAGVSVSYTRANDWPSDAMRCDFMSLPFGMLAGACLAASVRGPLTADMDWVRAGGGGWSKFCVFADQAVRAACGLPESPTPYDEEFGPVLSIMNGLIRADFDVRERHGVYVYCGLATPSNWSEVSSYMWPSYPGRDESPFYRRAWAAECASEARYIASSQRPQRGQLARLFDAGLVVGHGPRVEALNIEVHRGSEKGTEVGAVASGGQRGLFNTATA